MDSKLNELRCPNCGALINLVSDSYKCDYCDSKFTIDEYNNYKEKNIVDIDTLGIGDTLVANKVIPFNKGKKEFYRIIRSQPKLFNPSIFREIKIEDVHKVYVPYYVFDIKASGDTVLKCTDISKVNNNEFRYVNIKTYKTTINSNCDFIKLPICANKDFDESIIDLIEPFDVTKAIDMSDREDNNIKLESNVTLKEAIRLVSLKCKKNINDLVMKKTEHKISEITKDRIKYSVINEEIINFPVFYVQKEYKGKVYTFSMNGNDGKYNIKVPYSSIKIILFTVFILGYVFIMIFLFCLRYL